MPASAGRFIQGPPCPTGSGQKTQSKKDNTMSLSLYEAPVPVPIRELGIMISNLRHRERYGCQSARNERRSTKKCTCQQAGSLATQLGRTESDQRSS
jgi:hypothetical protein